MPEYKFQAILRDGTMVRNKMTASNKHIVIAKLKESKLQPLKISKIKKKTLVVNDKKDKQKLFKASFKDINKGKSNSNSFLKRLPKLQLINKVKVKDVIGFSNNFYILKKANFNNIKALGVLYNGTQNPRLKDIIEDLLIAVEAGEKLSDTMAEYQDVFGSMYISFVKLGEKTGSLDKALYYAREYLESSTQLTKNIKKVLVPRLAQFFFLMLMIIGGVILGVPMMQNVYDMFGSDAEIPAATQAAFEASQWLMNYWYIIVGIIALMIFGFLAYVNTLKGKYNVDKFILKFPVAGRLATSIIVSRFFQAMLMNLRNGMRIQEGLDISKEVTNNYYFLSIVELGRNNALAGGSWIDPFEVNQIFEPMTLQMVKVGMKTDLSEMMFKVTEYLDMEIKENLEKFTKWLPDVTYVIIGILLIIFMIVIMIPLIQIYMGSFLM